MAYGWDYRHNSKALEGGGSLCTSPAPFCHLGGNWAKGRGSGGVSANLNQQEEKPQRLLWGLFSRSRKPTDRRFEEGGNGASKESKARLKWTNAGGGIGTVTN